MLSGIFEQFNEIITNDVFLNIHKSLTGDLGPLNAIITWSIILLFVVSSWRWLVGYQALMAELKNLVNDLKGLSSKRNWAKSEENFYKLKDLILSDKYQSFHHHWHEFSESIVKETSYSQSDEEVVEYVNTEPAIEYFNYENIVIQSSGWGFGISYRFFDIVPTVLTGLGILGTFIGIVQGLPTSTQFEGELAQFLVGMKGAFVTSILGLSLGVFFNLGEKGFASRLESEVNNLAEQMDKLFKKKTSQDFLRKIEEFSRKQYDSIRSLAVDIGKEVVKGITGGGISTVDVSDSVKSGIAEGFDNLAKTLKSLEDAQVDFVKNTEELSAKYKAIGISVSNITKSAVECNKTIDNSTVGFSDAASSLGDVHDKIANTSQTVTSALTEQVKVSDALKLAAESAKEAVSQIEENNKTTVKEYDRIFSNFIDQVNHFNSENSKSLEVNLKSFDRELAGGMDKWQGNISSLKSLLESMQPAIADFEQGIQNLNGLLTNIQSSQQKQNEK